MKNILSILIACCTTFAWANEPIFEKTDENATNDWFVPFAAQEPNDDNNLIAPDACKKCDDPKHPLIDKLKPCESYTSWERYKVKFNSEKVGLLFPCQPTVTSTNTLMTLFAYENGVLYSFNGFLPYAAGINAMLWFNEILFVMSNYPYKIINEVKFQINGDWIMDYVAYDYTLNQTLKGRVIVTPYNGYTLQCVMPYGARNRYDYFLENFYIKIKE